MSAHKLSHTLPALLGLSMLFSGCMLRSTQDYTTDVRSLIETRSTDVRSCYDAELANNPATAGDVVVSFNVANKAGTVTDVVIDPSSSAPAALQECVASALTGLVLDPGDMAKAKGTFTLRFSPPAAAGA